MEFCKISKSKPHVSCHVYTCLLRLQHLFWSLFRSVDHSHACIHLRIVLHKTTALQHWGQLHNQFPLAGQTSSIQCTILHQSKEVGDHGKRVATSQDQMAIRRLAQHKGLHSPLVQYLPAPSAVRLAARWLVTPGFPIFWSPRYLSSQNPPSSLLFFV